MGNKFSKPDQLWNKLVNHEEDKSKGAMYIFSLENNLKTNNYDYGVIDKMRHSGFEVYKQIYNIGGGTIDCKNKQELF